MQETAPREQAGMGSSEVSSHLRETRNIRYTDITIESSPLRYAPSSSAQPQSDNLRSESSNGIFVSSRSHGPSGSALNNSRRGDIHSDVNGRTPTNPRRIFVDESGNIVRDNPLAGSDAGTFSNNDPNTSDAQAMGGDSGRVIWGTNVSIQDTMSAFKNFLRNFTKKYRMMHDKMTDEEISQHPDAQTIEYMDTMVNMLAVGATSLNLDLLNLKLYPSTNKLWHQVQAYPQEVIPLMDQSIKDIMVELAEKAKNKDKNSQNTSQNTDSQGTARFHMPSSDPPVPSSERGATEEPQQQQQRGALGDVDLVAEVESRIYKVRPFGLDQTINLRDLNPSGKLYTFRTYTPHELTNSQTWTK